MKRPRQGNTEKDDYQELLMLMTKLSLKNANELRAVIAVAFMCVKVKAESEEAKAVAETIKLHADITRGKKGHKEGAPGPFAFMKLLSVIVQRLPEEDKIVIQQFAASHPPKSPQVQSDILCMKHEVCYDKEHAKLYFKMQPEYRQVELIVHKALVASGGQHLVGSAPRGSLERRAQEIIDKMEGKTKQS